MPLIRTACRPAIVKTALKVALVVGLVLNAINQGGRLFGGEPILWGHVLLNFVVPFCVSSYSAARTQMRAGGAGPASDPVGPRRRDPGASPP